MTLPLTALVGLDTAVQALLLLAVEPALRGAVIAAPVGTGKSTLARGFAALLPTQSRPPFVELPLHADEDALLGGLDLEATLRTGRRAARAGALARADGGVLYVDQVNLLPDTAANLLTAALEAGEVRVEREGLSLRASARFSLIATYDPAEGPPRRHLLDRCGLLLVLPPTAEAAQRAEVVRRNRAAPAAADDQTDALVALVGAARALLPQVTVTDDQLEQLAAAALAFGVEGHRADAFAVAAARASAALGLRETVDHSDLELAVRLVILPRATRVPAPPEPPAPPEQPQQQQPPPPSEQPEQPDQPDDADREDAPQPESAAPDEQVLTALATELPAELETLPFRAVRRGRTGSRGAVEGPRGRHVRSAPGDVRRRRIDVPATLRAAAPWQKLRAKDGAPTTDQPALDDDRRPTSARSARRPPEYDGRRSSVVLRAEDLRVKHFRAKAGALFLFAVDASGSMALHRMRQAKGAVHALLQRAYVHRDRVALLAFRGDRADLLLPPSQSVELARRALDTLPTGGGTPLAAALLAALDVARQAQSRGIHQTVLVLLTDGRANVALQGDKTKLQAEIQALGGTLQAAGIRAVVVDTQRSYLSRGEARTLAGHLGGEYVYLPNASGEQIAAAVDASS